MVLLSVKVYASHKAIPGKVVPSEQYYRGLTQKLRTYGEFSVPFPGMNSAIKYSVAFDQPIYAQPILSDIHLANGNFFYRSFYDRILFKDGSHLEINGEKLPLTCVFIQGQDNRFGEKEISPLFPELMIRVTLVANDYSCQGPIRPGWPQSGGKEENWDTFLYYEIKDPTVMLPVEAKIRYRWNEYHLVLVDRGGQ